MLILCLTGSFFMGHNSIPFLGQLLPFGDSGALIVVMVSEVLVRLRNLPFNGVNGALPRQAMDNIRIGWVFSVVLEAFKLGS